MDYRAIWDEQGYGKRWAKLMSAGKPDARFGANAASILHARRAAACNRVFKRMAAL